MFDPEHLHLTQEIFADCNIDIRVDSQRHLGAVLGTIAAELLKLVERAV